MLWKQWGRNVAPSTTTTGALYLLPFLLTTFAQRQEVTNALTPFESSYMGCESGCGLAGFCTFNDDDQRNTSICGNCPASVQDCDSLELSSKAIDDCHERCDFAVIGEPCDEDMLCFPGRAYCDHETGVCKACVVRNFEECLLVSEDERTQWSCLTCSNHCQGVFDLSIGGVTIENKGVRGSPVLNASGRIVDCTVLVTGQSTTCPDAANGSICLMDLAHATVIEIFDNWINRCTDSGGAAALLYASFLNESIVGLGLTSFDNTSIPSATVSSSIVTHVGAVAELTVKEDFCWHQQTCNENIACIGPEAGAFCYAGWCEPCPTTPQGKLDPFQCFLDENPDIITMYNEQVVASCASACGAELTYENCKFCPDDVTGFAFGVEREADRCLFCPYDDVVYPDRIVRMFGEDVACWQMQRFFQLVEIHKGSQNCRLSQMMNYICGCTGPGYGGASTEARRNALVWVPRVMAILSVLGSSYIIIDATRTLQQRRRLFNQLMVTLSAFDIVGGCAYALTSLPIPATDYIQGAQGNQKTCIAQGFFIQIGAISCYLNVALSVYYFLVIRLGWSERRAMKSRLWLFLAPLVVGLAFACAGIPYFDNTILWCNNSAPYWPEIPVALAIALATIVMVCVCWDVYQKDRASNQWRASGGINGRSPPQISQRVFWQAFWYLMAFYLTWPPYLALQFAWASGTALTNYGLVLAAGTMAPLQGLWNFLVYVRPRTLGYSNRSRSMRSSERGAPGASLGRAKVLFWSKSSSLVKSSQQPVESTASVKGSFALPPTSLDFPSPMHGRQEVGSDASVQKNSVACRPIPSRMSDSEDDEKETTKDPSGEASIVDPLFARLQRSLPPSNGNRDLTCTSEGAPVAQESSALHPLGPA